MVCCFVPGCSHRHGREKCAFIRFPKTTGKIWEGLCRKTRTGGNGYRICSCHFEGGIYKNQMPTIFPWNPIQMNQHPDESTEQPSCNAEHFVYSEHSYSMICHPGCQEKLEKEIKQAMEPFQKKIIDLEAQLEALKIQNEQKIKILDLKIAQLKTKEATRRMTISDIKDREPLMLLYSSLPYDVFIILARCLQRFELSYHKGWKVISLSLEDQLLITLMKLKLNLRDLDLAHRFGVSCTTISNIFYTIVNALHELLFESILLDSNPSQAKCKGSMPTSFDEFVSDRVAMDPTERTMDVPYKLDDQAQSFGSYTSSHTSEAKTCVAPNAAIVHGSDLYPAGSTSDMASMQQSGMLHHKAGDLILADQGFTLHKTQPPGVTLNKPPFLEGESHLTEQETSMCSKIARGRTDVGGANDRLNKFEILSPIPAQYRSLSTKIFQVCYCLVNLHPPLLQEIAGKYDVTSEGNQSKSGIM